MLRLFGIVVGPSFWPMVGIVLVGCLVLLSCDRLATAQNSVGNQSAVAESVDEDAEDRDDRVAKPLTDEELALNPDLVAAYQSLDESLNYDGKPTGEQQTRDRLVAIGLMGGTLLALLVVLFGYLRLDHATRGFYSGRLQMLAGICAVGILAVCYFLWTQVLFK